MIVERTIAGLDLPRHGSVGLVPTMGALHAGHDALFAAARPACDVLVASLFVNPTQFPDGSDLVMSVRLACPRRRIDVTYASRGRSPAGSPARAARAPATRN